MTIAYNIDEAIETLRYVKPTFFSFDVDIPKEDAVTIEGPYPVFSSVPSIEVVFTPAWNWAVLLDTYFWGDTSRPSKVYYEIHVKGDPYNELNLPVPAAPVFRDGFYNNAFILRSNLENPACHIFVDKELSFKIWNATGADPEDIYTECTFWYYAVPDDYLAQVYAPYVRDSTSLNDLVALSSAQLSMNLGILGPTGIKGLLADVQKRTKKRERELGIRV